MIIEGKVAYGGEEAATANDVEVFGVRDVGVVFEMVTDDAVGDVFGVVIVEVGLGHVEGGEDVVVGELAKGLPRCAGDDFGEEEVACVAIFVLLTRLKIEVFLAGNEVDEVGIVVNSFGDVDTCKVEQGEGVTQATGVVNKVANGDGMIVDRHFGDVVTDVVVEGELAILGEQKDAGCGELFGCGGNVEDGIWRNRNCISKIGKTVTLLVNDVAILNDSEHATRGLVGEAGEEVVDLSCEIRHGLLSYL